MVTNKENLFKLGKKMTDRIPYKLGLKPMTEDCPEFWGMANVLSDEMVEVALTMKQRTPTSLQEAFKTGDEATLDLAQGTLTRLSDGAVFPLAASDAVAPVIAAGGLFNYARAQHMAK